MKPLTPQQIEDLEEQAKIYKVTDEDVKHASKFWKLMAWAFGIILSLAVWAGIIIKYIVRP